MLPAGLVRGPGAQPGEIEVWQIAHTPAGGASGLQATGSSYKCAGLCAGIAIGTGGWFVGWTVAVSQGFDF